ncbi:MAG TPA: hypothetical protein VGI39_34700, partial [Polyangiaceae bacterium]
RNGAFLGVAYALTFFAHETAMAAVVAVHLLFLILERKRRAWAVGVATIAVGALLAAGDMIAFLRIRTAAEKAYGGEIVFAPPWTSLAELPSTLFGSHPLPVLLALSTVFALSVVATYRGATPRTERHDSLFERLRAHRFAVAGMGFVVAYLVVPAQFFGVTMLNARFVGYAWALLLPSTVAGIGFLPPPGRLARLAVAVSATAAVALPLAALPAFLESQVRNSALDRVAAKMEPGQAMMVQRIRPRSADDLFTAVSCGRLLAQRGGRCQGDFTRTSIAPLRMREELLWSRLDEGRHADATGQSVLRPKVDLRAYRYLGFCCATPEEIEEYTTLLAPYARLVAEDSGWLLFESKLPRIPPNAPDRLLFAPPPLPPATRALP